MTPKCDHPRNQVVFDRIGGLSLAGGKLKDQCQDIIFCKKCRQVIDEKDIPWLHIEEPAAELEAIPF